MKVNMNGMELEVTPKEFMELSELMGIKKDTRDMSFDEEMKLIQELKFFKIVETEVSHWGCLKIVLKGDLR